MAFEIHGASCQVEPSWAKLGSSWPNLGSSWAKLALQTQAFIYTFTRCGSHALLERTLVQHGADMGENPPKMEAQGGYELRFFDPFSFLLAT